MEDLLSQVKLEQQIVALREKRGLTQRQLARLIGTSQPYVAKLESGRVRNLGVKTLVKCARALARGVSLHHDAADSGQDQVLGPSAAKGRVACLQPGGEPQGGDQVVDEPRRLTTKRDVPTTEASSAPT